MTGDILYTRGDVLEKTNRDVKNKIASANKLCEDFTLSCYDNEGVWAIWYQLGDNVFAANTLDLFNSIFEDDTYYMLEDTDNSNKEICQVNIRLVNSTYEWRIYDPNKNVFTCKFYTIKDYISKIKTSFTNLYEAWSNGKYIAYKDPCDIEFEGAKMCYKQLAVNGVMPDYYTVMTKDITIEKFTFFPLDNSNYENYTIGIGDRIHKTVLTQWDNDFECIRHQFESLAYSDKATKELYFDNSETTLKICKVSVLDKLTDTGDGHRYEYKDYALVEIIPNEFTRMPIIKGYCNLEQTVQALYEGLLRFSLMYPDETDESGNVHSYLETYNMIKSPIIEGTVTRAKRIFSVAETRQISTKLVLRICPDYCEILIDWKGGHYDVDWDGLIIPDTDDPEFEILDKSGKPIILKDLVDWQQEVAPIDIEAEVGRKKSVDWKNFHEKGLKIAHELRNRLRDDIDLWYSSPSWIDDSGIIEHSILIL